MSRVAKNPIVLPGNVEVKITDGQISVKGPLGTLIRPMTTDVSVVVEEGAIKCAATNDAKQSRAMSGTMRALLANMVKGVSSGFERKLTLVGVGYRAQAQGDVLNLTLGFSHPVAHKMPVGIKVETPSQTEILIKGVDKQQVGQVAAEIRAYRSPEPYKGKGVRYADEVVVLKETKKK
ncbi:large subunit ribosomal protein L6 [Chitinivorax tropicus]|uniref:Large ribosomal subunit protein uL6 n=1 Tax=Chitinivorax tropicus TaxID=714531 RepID=A0A840MZC4_9PROT|nr:50S ribosomal protein L6 [Chitinivorax tropicus]MBB5020501.1 large subunit ribosomal protein L6 [Chitinivorax tropicus]